MSKPGIIEVDEYIAFPPDRVWEALTDPDVLARWWVPGDVRPVVGHKFELDMGAWGTMPCEVLRVDQDRVFSYSYGSDTLGTTITWTLQPEGEGTRLKLRHSGFDLDSEMGRTAFGGMRGGWPNLLAHIGPALSGVSRG